jgi:hypothetical protein
VGITTLAERPDLGGGVWEVACELTLAQRAMSFLGRASEILQGPGYAAGVAHYLFNFVKAEAAQQPAPREQAAGFLRVRMWGVDADEPHRDALARGDLVLVYLGAPEREFIGRAELASAVHDWTPSEAQVYRGDSPSGVLLAQVEEWDPPVAMSAANRPGRECQGRLRKGRRSDHRQRI